MCPGRKMTSQEGIVIFMERLAWVKRRAPPLICHRILSKFPHYPQPEVISFGFYVFYGNDDHSSPPRVMQNTSHVMEPGGQGADVKTELFCFLPGLREVPPRGSGGRTPCPGHQGELTPGVALKWPLPDEEGLQGSTGTPNPGLLLLLFLGSEALGANDGPVGKDI